MRTLAATAIGVLAIVMAGCAAASAGGAVQQSDGQAAQYKEMKQEDAKKLLDEEEGVVLVDVRTQEEYDEKHIPGAILIPVESIGDERPEELDDLDTTILVYCRTGVRSKKASEKLVEMGYTNVYDIGGINDWPYETE